MIPFRLDISGSGAKLKGTLYDGFEPYDGTTSATFQDGKLVLNIEHYLTTITATVKDGQLVGNVVTQWEKVPQAVNLNTWPATIFVGRDGLVKGIHSGFASPASGEFNRQLKDEFTAKIEQLLAEKTAAEVAEPADSMAAAGFGALARHDNAY